MSSKKYAIEKKPSNISDKTFLSIKDLHEDLQAIGVILRNIYVEIKEQNKESNKEC